MLDIARRYAPRISHPLRAFFLPFVRNLLQDLVHVFIPHADEVQVQIVLNDVCKALLVAEHAKSDPFGLSSAVLLCAVLDEPLKSRLVSLLRRELLDLSGNDLIPEIRWLAVARPVNRPLLAGKIL